MNQLQNIKNKDIYLMSMAVLLFAVWQLTHIDGLRWEYDEGAYLAGAHLLNQGYSLYDEIFAVQPPLFFYSLLWAFWWPDVAVELGRITIIGFATIGLMFTGLIGQKMGGRWAGLLTVLLLSWHPRFLLNSKIIIGDVPSMSLAMVALWLGWQYHDSYHDSKKGQSKKGRGWLFVSGITMGLALGIKFLPAFLMPLFGLLIVLRHYKQKSLTEGLIDGLIFAVGLAMVWTAILWHVDLNAFIATNIAIRQRGLSAFAQLPSWFFVFVDLLDNFGYTTMSLIGLKFVWKNEHHGIWLDLWLVVTFITLVNYKPLWEHLLIVWAFPQAILIAIAIKQIAIVIKTQGQPKLSFSNATVAIAFLWFLLFLPHQFNKNMESLVAPSHASDTEIISFLRDNIITDRFIITDEPLHAVVTDKKLIPELADVSNFRLMTENLGDAELINLTEQYQPQVIIFGWDQRLSRNRPGYLAWVKDNYQSYPLENEGNLLFIEQDYRD